jgi:hypothetical protein
MSDSVFLLGEVDRICGQIAAAMQTSELQNHATVALIVVLSVLIFPLKDDPDQI